MTEKVPRRLKRFYRNENNYGQTSTGAYREEYNTKDAQIESKSNFSPSGRPILHELPSMSYEDLDAASKKKYDEQKRIEEESTARKLALKEVEDFKRKNNRMPNKDESEQIAENLYTQLKNIDTDKLYGIQKEGTQRSAKTSSARAMAARGQKKENENLQTTTPQKSAQEGITDIKSLLEEDTDSNQTTSSSDESASSKDEFDLGLEEDGGKDIGEISDSESGSIEDLAGANTATCPNCKKPAEKIFYCPKCGTAFCSNCSKKEANALICPKCKTKIKI